MGRTSLYTAPTYLGHIAITDTIHNSPVLHRCSLLMKALSRTHKRLQELPPFCIGSNTSHPVNAMMIKDGLGYRNTTIAPPMSKQQQQQQHPLPSEGYVTLEGASPAVSYQQRLYHYREALKAHMYEKREAALAFQQQSLSGTEAGRPPLSSSPAASDEVPPLASHTYRQHSESSSSSSTPSGFSTVSTTVPPATTLAPRRAQLLFLHAQLRWWWSYTSAAFSGFPHSGFFFTGEHSRAYRPWRRVIYRYVLAPVFVVLTLFTEVVLPDLRMSAIAAAAREKQKELCLEG